jgi:hypothetical protein
VIRLKRSTLPPIRSRQQNLGTAIYDWGPQLCQAAIVVTKAER